MSGKKERYTYDHLDEKLVKKVVKDLNENTQQVNSHIESLRRWVNSMPHIKNCRLDDNFLLRFLRTSKFDHSRAQSMLDNYLTIHRSEKGTSEWFEAPDPKFLDKYISEGFILPLGMNDAGELIVLTSYGGWDPETFPFNQILCCMYACLDQMIASEEVQIAGLSFINDMTVFNKKQMSHFESPKVLHTIMRNWQDAYPLRSKNMVYWNSPIIFNVLYNFFKNSPFLKKKLRDRLHKCGTDTKKLHELIGPGAKRLLPKEFGGENGTLSSIKDACRKNIVEGIQRERDLLADLEIDESVRPDAAKSFLKQIDDKGTGIDGTTTSGVTGTYTKFDV